ncbi:unnamed protein product [Cochlearia groenlandica]
MSSISYVEVMNEVNAKLSDHMFAVVKLLADEKLVLKEEMRGEVKKALNGGDNVNSVVEPIFVHKEYPKEHTWEGYGSTVSTILEDINQSCSDPNIGQEIVSESSQPDANLVDDHVVFCVDVNSKITLQQVNEADTTPNFVDVTSKITFQQDDIKHITSKRLREGTEDAEQTPLPTIRKHLPPNRYGFSLSLKKLDINLMMKKYMGKISSYRQSTIEILDALMSAHDDKKINAFMKPVVDMLPVVVSDIVGPLPNVEPLPHSFTFDGLVPVYQNTRAGDYGPLTVKFIELHCQGLPLAVLT